MIPRSTLLTALLGIATSACILAVSLPDTGGEHCRFAGSETTCGRCLAARCAAPIDACCFPDACGGVVLDVEACAKGDAEACGRAADPTDRGGSHGALADCAFSQCAEPCAIPAKSHVTHCERAYVTSIDACRCEIGALANDALCTEVGHPRLRCCAQDGWPAPVKSCECLSIICITAGAGCLCQLSAVDDQNRPTECHGDVCCADLTQASCSCGSTACQPGEKQVTSCTIDELVCGDGKRRVESCAVEK